MREIKHTAVVNEMANGFFQIETTGAVLSPKQFERLQEVSPSTLWITMVDPELQRARTEAGDRPIVDFKD